MRFLVRLGPIALGGLGINWLLVHWMYFRRPPEPRAPESGGKYEPENTCCTPKPVLVLVLVLTGFLIGVPAAIAAAVGAALLLITRSVDPRRVYDEVDWGLLVFFIGLFIIMGGIERAGLSSMLLRLFIAWKLQRLWLFSALTAVLSNIVSNVPATVLLKSLMPGFPDPQTGWLALAMASTLAGNLTITGSVANIIVVERASPEAHIGFRDYFRLGLPLTFLTMGLGILWLTYVP